MEGVQESTFYSVNQSQEDQEKRVISPLTQVESIYKQVDPLRIHVKNDRDRNASNFGKKTMRVKQQPKFMKAQKMNQVKDMMFIYNDGKKMQLSDRGASATRNYPDNKS